MRAAALKALAAANGNAVSLRNQGAESPNRQMTNIQNRICEFEGFNSLLRSGKIEKTCVFLLRCSSVIGFSERTREKRVEVIIKTEGCFKCCF